MRVRRVLSEEFLKSLASLLVFIVFSCVLSLFVYNTFSSILTEVEIARVEDNLSNACQLIDNQFMVVRNRTDNIMSSPYTQKFLNLKPPLNDADNYLIRQAYINFPKELNNFIEDVYVFNFRSNLILSSKYATSRASMFYGLILGYQDMSFEQWKESVSGVYYQDAILPASYVNINNKSADYFTYVQTYPVGTVQNSKGVILTLIPVDNLFEYLRSTVAAAPGWFAIEDKSGALLYSSNIRKEEIPSGLKNHSIITREQGDMLVVKQTACSGLRYTVAIPTEFYLGRLNETQKVFTYSILAFSILGFLAAFLLAYYTNTPVRKLVNSLQAANTQQHRMFSSHFNTIRSAVDVLRNENTTLYDRIRTYTPMVEFLVLRQLMLGDVKWESISAQARTVLSDITTWERYQILGIAFVNSNSDLNVTNGVILHNLLESHVRRYKLVSLANGTFFALVTWPNDSREAIQDQLDMMYSKARDAYSLAIAIGCSNVYHNLGNTGDGYIEAAQALKHRELSDCKIIWYDEIIQKSMPDSISINEERTLSNLVKSGNLDELELTIPFFNQRYLMAGSMEHMEKTGMQLIVIVNRIASGLPANDIVQQLANGFENRIARCGDMAELRESFRETMQKLCEQYKFSRKSQNEQLKKKMLDYIVANFTNVNFGTKMVADAMNISVSYLYHFFKEQFGENYQSFLERTRMEYCVCLMRNNRLSLREIAQRSGYENANTFYKAFKRAYGISPKTYRDNLLKQNS